MGKTLIKVGKWDRLFWNGERHLLSNGQWLIHYDPQKFTITDKGLAALVLNGGIKSFTYHGGSIESEKIPDMTAVIPKEQPKFKVEQTGIAKYTIGYDLGKDRRFNLEFVNVGEGTAFSVYLQAAYADILLTFGAPLFCDGPENAVVAWGDDHCLGVVMPIRI